MSDPRWKPSFTKDNLTVEHRERVYDGFFKMDKLKLRHSLFAGGEISIARELFLRDEAVCMLPYDPLLDEVVLVEQFRIGAIDHPKSPWLLELVAGIVEPDEQMEEVAIREAEEEAGLTVEQLEPICRYLVSPGGACEYITLFCGRVDASQAGGIHGLAAEGEDIKVHRVAVAELFEMVADGRVDNAASIIAAQWLQINHARLRDKWLQN